MLAKSERAPRARVRKRERLENILLELKLRPHVRTADLAQRFGVSYETIRRDCEVLSEAAVVGPDAIEFIARHNVQKCSIGASSVSAGGVSEAARGFAAIKRAMLGQSEEAHLLVDGTKIGGPGLSRVAELTEVATVILDKQPEELLACALESAGVRTLVAAANIENTLGRTPGNGN